MKEYKVNLKREGAYEYELTAKDYNELMKIAKEACETDLVMTWEEIIK